MIQEIENTIKKLMAERRVYFDRDNAAYREFDKNGGDVEDWKSTITEDEHEEIDAKANQIIMLCDQHKWVLPIDFIIEALNSTGKCVSIAYDDDGHYAVCQDGYGQVNLTDEPIDMSFSFHVQKEYWCDTIREALVRFLEIYNKEIEEYNNGSNNLSDDDIDDLLKEAFE